MHFYNIWRILVIKKKICSLKRMTQMYVKAWHNNIKLFKITSRELSLSTYIIINVSEEIRNLLCNICTSMWSQRSECNRAPRITWVAFWDLSITSPCSGSHNFVYRRKNFINPFLFSLFLRLISRTHKRPIKFYLQSMKYQNSAKPF